MQMGIVHVVVSDNNILGVFNIHLLHMFFSQLTVSLWLSSREKAIAFYKIEGKILYKILMCGKCWNNITMMYGNRNGNLSHFCFHS